MSAPQNTGHTDATTREQVRNSLDKNLYVEAGAGTGKTEILVTRLSELLLSDKALPTEIAAITFTRAAAFEMRSRIRADLERRLAAAGSPEDSSRILTVLDGLDSLNIQTIHAFALSILREHPLEAGLPPIVEPVDDIQASVEFDDRWNEWFGQQAENDIDLLHALSNAQRLGLTTPADRLRELAQRLNDQYHLLKPEGFAYDGPEPPPVSVSVVKDTLAEVQFLADVCPIQDDTMCVFVYETVVPVLESLIALAGTDSQLPAEDFAEVRIRGNGKGSKQKWRQADGGESALDALREKLSEFQDLVDASLDVLRRKTAMKLFDASSSFAIDYAESRRVEGRLTFDDQLVLARRLLESDSRVRQRIQAQYRYLLVDEFQDTDPVQLEILRLLAGKGPGGFRPGSLFIVGDPKQSIYRFRGADPASAALFSSDIAHTGDQLTLSENHRSVPGILKWTNSVFSSWMKEGEGEGQAPYGDLAWEPRLEELEEPGAVPVQWFGGERDASAADTRRLEFDEIAAIAEASGAGEFRVRDRDGSTRESDFSDVAVLLRTRTGLDALEEALTERNIPYVFDGQSPLFTSQDVRDLHSCLVAIDDPSDEVALLAAIRSPAFSCSDVDLLLWTQAGGGFNYLSNAQRQDSGPVATAFKTLRHFHSLSRETAPVELIEKFVRDRKLREKAMLSHQGLDRAHRLDMVVELANAVAESAGQAGGMTLRSFTRWLARQSDENARIPDHVSHAMQGEAVRIMTVHSAKGLEFPIVIVASSSGGGGRPDTLRLVPQRDQNGEERLEVQLGGKDLGLRTDGAEQALADESVQEQLEAVRLMYVAATRARDHLFVSRYRTKRSKNSLPEQIENHLEGNESLWREWRRPTQLTPRRMADTGSPDTVEQRDAWVAKRAEAVASASRTRYTTPTAIKSTSGRPVAEEKVAVEPSEDEPSPAGRAATDLGRAVHAVLQHVDLAGWDEPQIEALASRMSEDHGVADSKDEVVSLATAAMQTPIMRRAAQAAERGEAWREVSVAAVLPENVGELEGQIDLLFVEDDGSLTVVDHKTDRERGNSVEQAAEPYLLQMGAYAWCVEQVTGKQVTRAVLVFSRRAQSGTGGEYEVPDLETHKREAAQLAAEHVSAMTASG